MLKKWLPLNYILKRAARSYGFIDPVKVLARLRQFGHPSEVQEPIELIRAGVVFHARGLINTRAIQYNLDWVWPYWVVKQFKPNDSSFIPRGFSFSHVNLTHRNWTAVGLPDTALYPIVDPRGLVTPFFDGWSLDFWVRSRDGSLLLPSQCGTADQRLDYSSGLAVHTTASENGLSIKTSVRVVHSGSSPRLVINAEADAEPGAAVILALRPYNPEGIQFIDHIAYDRDRLTFLVNNEQEILMDRKADKVALSNYETGDVSRLLREDHGEDSVQCPIGMATSAAFFTVGRNGSRSLEVCMDLARDPSEKRNRSAENTSPRNWETYTANSATLQVPDDQIRFLYDAAVRTIILLSSEEAFPGPYTYKRFWFRDSCFMINALLAIGMAERSERLVRNFPELQKSSGYFQSQEGEWDSNGQVLWIADRLQYLTGCSYDGGFLKSLFKGARWIEKKRGGKDGANNHEGLFPPGFSAEHLGPNDYYYWDNFWGLAGLRAGVRLADRLNMEKEKNEIQSWADDFENRIFSSIAKIPENMKTGAVPASPYRRMDAGAVGSLVADYPLQLTKPGDERILGTIDYLMENCFHSGAFFQDMIHSGINIYLTLAIAQTFLRSGDSRYRVLIDKTAELASPTGQWPEAIHPITGGGCMGDGQHGWAAAEWIMMIRNLFVREEADQLIIGSGVFPRWLESGETLVFGPTLAGGGRITVRLRQPDGEGPVFVDIEAAGVDPDTQYRIQVPGFTPRNVTGAREGIRLEPEFEGAAV